MPTSLPGGNLKLADDLTVSRVATERAAATGTNYSEQLFQAISEYLTPEHPARFPG